jgi:WD40 repeat protein
MKRIAFLVFVVHLLTGTNANARQEIYVKSLQTQEILKTPITKASATSSILAVATNDKIVKLIDIASLNERSSLVGLINPVSEVSLTASGQSVVTASGNGQVTLWNTSTGVMSKNVVSESEQITALTVQGETLVYVAGNDKNVRILDVLAAKELGSVSASPEGITTICLHPFEKMLAIGTSSGRINIYALGGLSLTDRKSVV